MPPPLILDPATLDLTRVVADREAIRRVNPQRFEMEHLTAVVLADREQHVVAGYRDVGADEFWVRGHMPGYPLLPGVLICEAAAQLASYYIVTAGLLEGAFLGFGGMDGVRFRRPVRPGDRLVLVGKAVRLRQRHSTFAVQGFVGNTLVFQGDIFGVAMDAADPGAGAEED
jgi:3-hydroxyacyl-[acyl-carrier-protein] dehydratase